MSSASDCITESSATTQSSAPDEDIGNAKVALVTGAAVRVGRAIAIALHSAGYRLVIHCNDSVTQARQLQDELNG